MRASRVGTPQCAPLACSARTSLASKSRPPAPDHALKVGSARQQRPSSQQSVNQERGVPRAHRSCSHATRAPGQTLQVWWTSRAARCVQLVRSVPSVPSSRSHARQVHTARYPEWRPARYVNRAASKIELVQRAAQSAHAEASAQRVPPRPSTALPVMSALGPVSEHDHPA